MKCRFLSVRPFRVAAGALIALLLAVFAPRAAQAQEGRRPNIIFVLLDNLGWGELGCYGGGTLRGAPTPRIDAFANEGLRLTNFNVEASCTPTRSALMTGRFSVRSGNLRSGATGLVRWEVTVAQLLKQRGYATAAFGKWHLGDEPGRYPTDFGFDEWYGIPRSSGEALNRLSPGYRPQAIEPEYILHAKAGGPVRRVKEYDMQARRDIDGEIIDRTIDFVSREAGTKKPFFAFVPMTQVHYPTVPSAAFAGKSGFGDFADSVMQTDYLVGKLLGTVDRLAIAQDTIVIVASDNGPEYRRPWRGTAGPWTGTYHTMMEGGLRAPFLVRWTGHIKPSVSDGMVHAVDIFNTLVGAAGGAVPKDRPIDGVDQMPFFLGAAESRRDGFPIYIEKDFYGIKYRDWKYHVIWEPDPEIKPMKLDRPFLFNITADPKEESPRNQLEDGWVRDQVAGMIKDAERSLEKYPPVPFGSALTFVPATNK